MAAYIVCQAFISVTCPLKNTMIPTRTVDGSMGGKYKFIQEIWEWLADGVLMSKVQLKCSLLIFLTHWIFFRQL